MNNQQKIKRILQEIQKIRLKINIRSEKLQDFLYYQHLKVSGTPTSLFLCGLCGVPRQQVTQTFKRAFKTLSDLQKAQYYLMNVKNIEIILNAENGTLQNKQNKQNEQIEKTKLILKGGSILKKQSVVSVQIVRKQKILKFLQNKTQIDLHNFLIRKSKNKSLSHLVLQATHPSPVGNTIRINKCESQSNDILNIISSIWKEAQYQNLQTILAKSIGERDSIIKQLKPKSQMLQFTRQLQREFKIVSCCQKSEQKNKLLLNDVPASNREWYEEIIQSFSNFNNFQQISFGQCHEKRGLKIRKSLMLVGVQNGAKRIQQVLKSEMGLKKLKQFVKQLKIIEIKKNEYFIEQLHEIQGELICLYYNRKFLKLQGTCYIIDKQYQIQNEEKHPCVKYCVWRLRENGDKVEILVQGRIQYRKNDRKDVEGRKMTSKLIGELSNIVEDVFKIKMEERLSMRGELRLCKEQQQIFYTVPGSLGQDHQQQQY